jgi:hypothetical protein
MVKVMYYIYEIPGVKIGCTESIKFRQQAQRHKGEMIILEQHEDIMVASSRERELQKEKGYKVDYVPYYKSHAMAKEGLGGKIGGKKSGLWAKDSGHLERIKTRDSLSKGGSVTSSKKAKCPWCDMISNPPGIGNHKKACKFKPVVQ